MKKITLKHSTLLFLIILAVYACKKEEINEPIDNFAPGEIVITTKDITDVLYSRGFYFTAKSGGTIIDAGNSFILNKGVCWNTTGEPTIDDTFITAGFGSSQFSTQLWSLDANLTYHIRAFAINAGAVFYGNEITFSPQCSFDPSLTGTSLDLSSVCDTESFMNFIFDRAFIIGGGLNYTTMQGFGSAVQYGGTYAAIYAIKGVGSNFITTDEPQSVRITSAEGSILELWNLDSAVVVTTNASEPGVDIIFTAQPGIRYGGIAWYEDNSQKSIAIMASIEEV